MARFSLLITSLLIFSLFNVCILREKHRVPITYIDIDELEREEQLKMNM